MKKLGTSRSLYIALALCVVAVVVAMMLGLGGDNKAPLVTTTVETGTVQQLVSVSGIADAVSLVNLAFPTTGIVATVPVRTGDTVAAGDIIATLDTRTLEADRLAATADLKTALANRAELIAGPIATDRAVTNETVRVKQQIFDNTKATEAEKVANAYRTLLSTDLAAYSTDPDERAIAPTITGTYTCGKEGKYTVEVFSSAAKSGFSFRLSGLETGTFVGSTDQPTPLGACGLQILFASNSVYANSKWTIEVPNTRAASHVTNRNAYNLAVNQKDSAITLAEQELALAEASAIQDNAPARSEALARADAAVIAAEARLARIDAEIAERTLRAPFAGTVTDIDILPGETVTSASVATLLATSAFEVTARIPEIDMGKLRVGQKALMRFDAKDDEYVVGEIDYISLNATEIDGVAYFEARITLSTPPVWMRSGLNADVEIVVNEATDVLRIPKRFLTSQDGTPAVRSLIGTETATTAVTLILEGNDGYVAISGVSAGDTLVAP